MVAWLRRELTSSLRAKGSRGVALRRGASGRDACSQPTINLPKNDEATEGRLYMLYCTLSCRICQGGRRGNFPRRPAHGG